MEIIAYVEIDALALVYLLLIFIHIRHSSDLYLISQKLFLSLIALNALIITLDAVLWALDGAPGAAARAASVIMTFIYYIMNPAPCILWCAYTSYLVDKDISKLKRISGVLFIPFAVNFVLSAANIAAGFYYYFDANNYYHRGGMFFIMPILCYIYLLSAMLYIIINRKKIEQKFFIPVMAFAIPPLIGGLIQGMFYGVSLVWICMTVSIQIIYINIQNEQIYKDHLTGLYNRRQLDSYLRERIKNGGKGGMIAGIMIDLNSFKHINDNWGHSAGDQALMSTAAILTRSLRKNDLVCRYGGDEFVIIVDITSKADMPKIIERIKLNTDKANSEKAVPYHIDFSIGCDFYEYGSGVTAEQFLTHLDRLMYSDKRAHMCANEKPSKPGLSFEG